MRGGKAVCDHYGGYSTGPRSKEGKDRIRATYLKHSGESLVAKADHSEESIKLRYLIDLGNHCSLFYKQLKAQDRPPRGIRS
jgi:hypothetical protein